MATFGALVIFLILRNFTLTDLIGLVFNPYAGLLILVVIAQFLWLKSSDRTRIYKLEADRLRELRRKDEKMLRQARDVIDDVMASVPSDQDQEPDEGSWEKKAIDLRAKIEERL